MIKINIVAMNTLVMCGNMDIQKLKKCFEYIIPQKHHKIYYSLYANITKNKQLQDTETFFEHYWKRNNNFNDRTTINPHEPIFFSNFHYNLVENNIIKFLTDYKFNLINLDILDIGSGTGHWLNFYSEIVTKSNSITGIEISETACRKLQQKFNNQENIKIVHGDISSETFDLNKKFDIINAIGVMFHVTDDELWKTSIKNLSNCLKLDGIAIIGGDFGFFTHDAEFNVNGNDMFVLKKLRSKRIWQRVLKENGCKVIKVIKANVPNNIHTPQNNLLIFKRR